MERRAVLVAVLCMAVGGCTETVPLVGHANVGAIRPLPVAMEPPLRELRDRVHEGARTLVVPTGQLLAYHFPGVSAGTVPRATLHLIDSRLEVVNSGTDASGPLGRLGGVLYLSVVEGYDAHYALTVEAIAPDGVRHTLTGRGEGRVRMDAQAAIIAAVVQAVDNLREHVEDVPPPAAFPQPSDR